MKPRNAKEEYLARQSRRLLPEVSPGAIRLRVLDFFRADRFKGLLADAILRSRFSANAIELARSYVAEFCPGRGRGPARDLPRPERQ
ncbi:MAG: hypothetical protein WC708_14745 [Lentisphaeria bacterium]